MKRDLMTSSLGSVVPDFYYGLMPNPDISIVEYAEKNLYLVSGKNPFPGLVDFSRTPYLHELMDALMPDNGIERVVLMKGWQTGGTLTILAWMLWVMGVAPAPMIIVQPTDELREKFSKQRINPIIANCRDLRERVAEYQKQLPDSKREKDTLISKQFPGGHINLATSTSEPSLRSESAQYLAFDEVSAYDEDCQGHGDPCGLALGRTSAYDGRKKIFYNSTPTIRDYCRIEREYLTTDQRKLFVPCLSCGEMQVLVWANFDLTTDDPAYPCILCGYRHFEQDKIQMLTRAEWRPTATSVDGGRGYHLPALYAPPGMWSWKSSLQQFRKGLANPVEMKVFVNNCLGEPYEDDTITSCDPNDLMQLREDYWPEAKLPEGIGVITAGVDTHPTHVDIVVVGWGCGNESWVLDYWIEPGDSNAPELWARVQRRLRTSYPHSNGVSRLRIATTCVDTGGHNTGAVYDFCSRHIKQRILPIKGSKGPAAPYIDHPTIKKEAKVFLFPVGKLATHGRLFSSLERSMERMKEYREALGTNPKARYRDAEIIHFHKNLPDSFFKELAAPKKIWRKVEGKFQMVYETVAGVADHAHDCLRYAHAARENMDGINIDQVCENFEKRAGR
ncbi:terminase gpA endonuclease subunit [Oligoflexus tunisiensis]|uniref:terminase gpA endonuclease subunit n=1 Tax=Oligoflexus tunisiensis TaxID=708132 RepID=UPI00114C9003|nr:terminase gpA endonuclease subunit [Oligoflexus tunisiensis]